MSTNNDRLFPGSLIPAATTASFLEGFQVRPLCRSDYAKGFLDCLRVLTHVGDTTEVEFGERYDEMKQAKGTYYYLVIEHGCHIVGTGALIVEKKFIHDRGTVGHIEEISIAKEHQSKGLGRFLLRTLKDLAISIGCYKVVLNCSVDNEPFYNKCGYSKSGTEMVIYFEELKDEYYRG